MLLKNSQIAIEGSHAVVNGICKENLLDFPKKVGRPPRLSFAMATTILIRSVLSRRKDFKAFYCGLDGAFLRKIFPEMTCYSAFLRRVPLLGEILAKFLHSQTGMGFYIIDSTTFKLCENVRFYSRRLFPKFAGWAHSSTRCVFGFKLHLAVDGAGKIVAFRLTNGSRHDVKEAENLLRGRMGTAIGDRGYCSRRLKTRFAEAGLRFIAHTRKNMKDENTPEEKQLLRRRNLVERVIGKLKRHIGDSFSRFRAWGAVQATIAIGILAVNLGC
jgi:transposase